MVRSNNIQEDSIPLSEEIKDEALNKYFSTIKCKKWSERNQ